MNKLLYIPIAVACTFLIGACGDSVVVSSNDISIVTRETPDAVDSDKDGLFEIRNYAQLSNIRFNLAGDSYKSSADAEGVTRGCPKEGCVGYEIVKDLNLSLIKNWVPVGDEENPFTAILDGNSKVIRNLSVDSTDRYVGFFGYLDGTVRNLSFENGSIYGRFLEGTDKVPNYVGVVAGLLGKNSLTYNIFSNISVKTIEGGGDLIGGLAGANYGLVEYSYAVGNVDSGASAGCDLAGGLIGKNVGQIKNSYANGKIRIGGGKYSAAGGLVGRNIRGSIESSRAIGDVWASSDAGTISYSGGLVGANYWYTSIKNSYATGNVIGGSGKDYSGGLAGYNFGAISNSYSTGNVDGSTGNDFVGALVGYNERGASVDNSYSTGNVEGNKGGDTIGSLLGRNVGVVNVSYYFSGNKLSYDPRDLRTEISIKRVKAKSDSELRNLNAELIMADFGYSWSETNWEFTGGYYPSLKSFLGSALICDQPAETHVQCP